MKPLVLFDVDGTLLLTGGAGMRAMRRAASTLFGASLTWEGIEVSGHLDPLIFAEVAALNGIDDWLAHHDSFRAGYLEALREEIALGAAAVRAMPGVHLALARLRSEGCAVLGLLTGNYTSAIPLKLGAVGIDPAWFEVNAFGDEAESRSALVRLAIGKYERRLGCVIDPGRVLIVGDTPRDVACAHANGCRAFAVATGKYDQTALREAGADFVVADLGEPSPLLEVVRALSSARDSP